MKSSVAGLKLNEEDLLVDLLYYLSMVLTKLQLYILSNTILTYTMLQKILQINIF